jgi:heme-degrading monooxygenase HmoA
MYIAVRRYKVKPGSIDEIIRSVSEGFVPLISQAPGFIAYYAADAGNDILLSVSIFQDQAGADESIRAAAGWVKQNPAAFIEEPPEITAGEVKTYKAK